MVIKWTESDIIALFDLAGCPGDFCRDVHKDDKIVYGGWNRIYLYPDGSVKVSESHCSQKFLAVCRELGMEII